MPFGLKFKRTRRYDISTKNVFVVGVEMLDHSYLECTLNSDSTGQECLESIAQRIELSQTQYFGLRYVTKKMQYHWIDLTKPLKKQIEKNLQPGHSPRLYFGVLFYIPGAHKIVDDVARYQYFLQLKTDIVEGRIPVSVEQVIRLGAFSLQAEFGDYEYDKQQQEYFEDNDLFPKAMYRDENAVGEMMHEVLSSYTNLQGIHQVKAEMQYIKEIQMMDGYGMEYYTAKDERSKELYLGTSYTGILARYLDGSPTICFRWNEIARLTQSKKVLEIDTSKSSCHYTMEDSDTAKYLKRMGYLIQKFHKTNKMTPSSSLVDLSDLTADQGQDDIQTSQQIFSDPLTQSQTSLTYSQHSAYSQVSHDQRFDPDLSQSSIEDFYRQSQQSLETTHSDVVHYSGDGSFTHVNGGQLITDSPVIGQHTHIQRSESHRSPVLPAYRPSPSYEEVMHRRMGQQPSAVHGSPILQPHQHPNTMPDLYPQTSPRLLHEAVLMQQPAPNIMYNPDVTYTTGNAYMTSELVSSYSNNTMYANRAAFTTELGNRGSNLVIQPTYSSPELNSQLPQFSIKETEPLLYKPPPPYPRSSTSTPDLANQTVKGHVGESPDLVSRKTLGVKTSFNGSVDNVPKVVTDHNELKTYHTSSENVILNQESAILHRDTTDSVEQSLVLPDISTSAVSPDITVQQPETDDASSDHSGATFHVKDTDSEKEDDRSPKLDSVKSKIAIKFVAPNKAPPPSTSKELITRRESFRRQMIARTTQDNPIGKDDPQDPVVIPEHNDGSSVVVKPTTSQSTFIRRFSSRRLSHKKPDVPPITRRASDIATKFTGLDVVPPVGNYVRQVSAESEEPVAAEEDSDSDYEKDATVKLKMGPLKMAAMNGLTMSRPMVLALMNDESRAPKDERRKLLENKLSENLVFKEFEEIPKKVPSAECVVARLPENESRNRFRDVLPYDVTRVKLTPRKDNHSGYVNASHIKLSFGDRMWWYIATQAPLEETTTDFWQMVWEQEVDVIAMLTDLSEQGKQKCYTYWPQEIGQEHKITFGQFEVTLLFCNDSLCYITNRISVVHLPTKKEKQVWHLQYTDWPDHGCPEDMYGFLGFLDEVDSVQRLAESEEGSGKKSPILVHCSAGAGRTGVVILTQVMKWCLEHNFDIDLPKALGAIRQQRMFMVQTLGQYNFIHKTLIQYLKNSRLI
ncbi:LOW QUALITY PROTEIN: tyrosine-protein phosphatase non-receptor type 21-like [Ostrea edulis]|uniref:LOW QUALITY PROTEIN: tyrosine-protein phosphatase non-receptor type 21-like n=1 Tax=Ostrea edulis TaxID=37623 RepID=UPI0024AED4CF|nr:LOW QUALITY PROTEIN: tyrosine-protein phosphatase non-receptor type 21-like [Ostrea edulis]